jgi:hypothetical protein
VLPQKEAENPPFQFGPNSYATYVNPATVTKNQEFPSEPLYVIAPVPKISYDGLYEISVK